MHQEHLEAAPTLAIEQNAGAILRHDRPVTDVALWHHPAQGGGNGRAQQIRPCGLQHPQFDEMIDWYLRVFEARIQHRDARLAFLTYDDEHHRFAFLNLGPAADTTIERAPNAVGVNHLAYTWSTVGELLDTYKRLKSCGITPFWPVRHGLTLSLYYRDPDGNALEFQTDVMSAAEANRFMAGPAFAHNPIGENFDPDELARQFDSGAAIDGLIFRSDQPESRQRRFTKAPA
jgi:catechol 2,3-dioxygenase-like lactoylglutathione lyase family enzyme